MTDTVPAEEYQKALDRIKELEEEIDNYRIMYLRIRGALRAVIHIEPAMERKDFDWRESFERRSKVARGYLEERI